MSSTAMNRWWQDRGFRLTHKATGISVVYRTKGAHPKPDEIGAARRWLSSLAAHAGRIKTEPIRRSYILAPEHAARVVQGAGMIGGEVLVSGRDEVLAMLAGRLPGPRPVDA